MDWIFSLTDMAGSALWVVASFILILSIVVFVHEFGHFWVARRAGVQVEVFSIGFGREIFGWTDRHGTRWRFSLFPLGGYVRLFGDTEALEEPLEPGLSAAEKARSFRHKDLAWRSAVVFGGPLFNFLFAFVVLTGLLFFAGKTVTPPEVDHVIPFSAAARAGVQIGDRIVAVDGRAITTNDELVQEIQFSLGNPLTLSILRDGAIRTIIVAPALVNIDDPVLGPRTIPRLGIANYNRRELQSFSLPEAILEAGRETYRMTVLTLRAVGQMITGQRSTKEITGVIKIADLSGRVTESGFQTMVGFLALLSLNLGLFNLFPIPLLDGGRLMFYGIEAARGKPLSRRAQNIGFQLGLLAIASLFLLATYNDLTSYDTIRNLIEAL